MSLFSMQAKVYVFLTLFHIIHTFFSIFENFLEFFSTLAMYSAILFNHMNALSLK